MKRIVTTLVVILCLSFIASKVSMAFSDKILIVIAKNNFRDEEFKIPYDALVKAGYDVVIGSSMLNTANGVLGTSIDPDILLVVARPEEYKAVIFIGGSGAQEYFNDKNAHRIAKEMYSDGKLVAAICVAPVILANAGILEGKKATVQKSESHNLEFKGASYTGRSVQVDGNIITADGPMSAQEFTDEIIRKLEE